MKHHAELGIIHCTNIGQEAACLVALLQEKKVVLKGRHLTGLHKEDRTLQNTRRDSVL